MKKIAFLLALCVSVFSLQINTASAIEFPNGSYHKIDLSSLDLSYAENWYSPSLCNSTSLNFNNIYDKTRYCVAIGAWKVVVRLSDYYYEWSANDQRSSYYTFLKYHNSKRIKNSNTQFRRTTQTFWITPKVTVATAELKNKTNRLNINMEGSSTTTTGKQVVTEFHSPYLYLTNPPAEATIQLSSAFNNFVAEPEFNLENGWKITAENADQPLFYEAETASVSLNRHGRNFDSRAELTEFLDSEFLPKLGFSAVQSQNSLDYLVPKLPEANYYYLTILSPEAISQFSNLEISPAPESLTRTFYAIYPSAVPVSTVGDFVYPEPKTAVAGFEITELGEILVGEGIYVLWENN